MNDHLLNSVQHKIDDIAMCILENWKIQNDNNNFPGLLGNNWGAILFLLYYNIKDNKNRKISSAINKILNLEFENLSDGYYNTSYATGVTGILYGLEFINSKRFVNIDISAAKDAYNVLLVKVMLSQIANKEYDLLHKALGIGYYFLEYGNTRDLENLKLLLSNLELIGEKTEEDIKWKARINDKIGTGYGIALAHGISSIIIFLTRMFEANIEKTKVLELLSLSINYLLKQEINPKINGSFFPTCAIETMKDKKMPITKSRLAWCYGDLGIAMSLLQAGYALKNQSYIYKAIEVLKYSCMRTDLEDNLVLDTCLCHGTAGIAQIFKRAFILTGETEFQKANIYWIEQTLKMANWQDGFVGYKFWKGDALIWSKEIGLLEGVSGVGLALLASIKSEDYSSWDKILFSSK